ncbi:MAG: 23S rRNA (guanosine(2251)-2'-O)-methyltransferase RlmB [Gammaproteobacteria bacterium]|jgi:23S rRNA (guanosine2251-2'-O)-methyltransferase
MMVISGFHAVESILIQRPELIVRLFISRSEDKRVVRVKDLAKTSQINSELIDSKKIDRLAGHSKHQGFAAEISNLGFLSEKDIIPRLKNLTTSRVLILDSIQDPRNLGACLRSALAFEFDAVIINKDGSSPINEYVFKTSVGAILNLNIFYVTNLSRSINTLKDIGFWVLGLDGHGEGSIFSEKFSSKTAVVLGSEGSGIRKLVKENCDHLIKIPISKKVESLNISVAAGIIMYELKKQHIN